MDDLTGTLGILALAAAAVALLALILCVILFAQVRRLRSAQRRLLGGEDTDLVSHADRLQREFFALDQSMQDMAAGLENRMGTVEARLDGAIAHCALVRYDAYNEMSGHQSTSIALLDTSRSGVVLSSILHRDQARLYVKRVEQGRGELELSPEEAEAVRIAMRDGSGVAGRDRG